MYMYVYKYVNKGEQKMS